MSHNVNGTGRRSSLFPGPGPVDMQSLLAPLEVPTHQSTGDSMHRPSFPFPPQLGYQPEHGGALPAQFGEANLSSSFILQNSTSHALDLFDQSSYADISDEEIAGLVTEIECGINGPPEDMYDNLDVAIRRMSCANSAHPVQAATKTTALRRLSLLLLNSCNFSAQNGAASAGDCGSAFGTPSAVNNSQSSAPLSSGNLLGQCPGRRNSASFIPKVEHRVGINNDVNACSALASFGSVAAPPDQQKRPRRSEAYPFPGETPPSRKPKYTRRNSVVEAGASPFRSSESGRGSFSSASRRTSISCALPRQANLGLHVQASGFPQAEGSSDDPGTNDEVGLIATMNPVKQQLRMLSAPHGHSIGSNVHQRIPATAMHSPPNALAMQQQDPRHDQHTVLSVNSLSNSMKESRRSQKMIEDWDRKMGLRRAHSQTVRNSTRSRKLLQESMKRLNDASGL